MVTRKLKGIVRLFRPELPFAAGVCVILGEVIALGGFPPFQTVALGFACGFFISGSALILNDYFDLAVDRVNQPQRPLPAGLVTPAEAVALTLLATLIGLAAAWMIGLPALLLAVVFWGVGVLYNWKTKEMGLLGNLMVSASVAVTFILGGVAVGGAWNRLVWLFALIAFLIDLGEEIAGDAMDMAGDRLRSSRSLAIRIGRQRALSISAALFALIVLISWAPIVLGWLGLGYLVMLVIMDLTMVYFTLKLLKSRTPAEGRSAMRGIYLGATVGVLAMIVAQIFS